jgi:uncharacterized membrane protein
MQTHCSMPTPDSIITKYYVSLFLVPFPYVPHSKLGSNAVYCVFAIFLGATKQTVGVHFKSVYDHLLNRFPLITLYDYIITGFFSVKQRDSTSNERQK